VRSHAAGVQAASFVIRSDEISARFVIDGRHERMRCASVLKPLVFWAAGALPPLASAQDRWERLARAAVTVSGNDQTVEAWEACGGFAILDCLGEKTGVRLPLEAGGRRAFGRVLITAGDVARGYGALAASREANARRLLGWMLDVPDHQTFGVRPVVGRELGVSAASVAVKCGWFCDADEERIRTHVVTVTSTPAAIVGTVVLSAFPMDEASRRAYTAAYRSGDEVLSWHERHAGETVRVATEEAVAAALGPQSG
jgi:hypothetical protein